MGLCQDNRLTVKVDFSLTDLYVVDLVILRKVDQGHCDCSVGQKSKDNDCRLYEIKIKNLKYQADSTVFTAKDIFEMAQLIVSKDLTNKIRLGENLNVILTNTSSKEYLQFKSLLTPAVGKEFSFSSNMQLTSLIECKDNQLTFRKK
jgi:hypothetical protein